MRCIGSRRSFGQNVYDPAHHAEVTSPSRKDVAMNGKYQRDEEKYFNTKDQLTIHQQPMHSPEHYFNQSDYYFNSLESKFHWHRPKYAKDVIRWEWSPWLMLTAMGKTNIIAIDSLIRLCPCIVTNRSYRYFPQQPFVRSLITIYYGDEVIRRGQPLRIYEEFTFNDLGEISFIEAWWAREGEQLPLLDNDGWPVEQCISRLSTRLPGLGSSPYGSIDLDSPAMLQVSRRDPDVMDFRKRCKKFYSSVVQELVNDMLKNRESILGMRIRKRTNSFIFRTNSFPGSASASSSPSSSSRSSSMNVRGREREVVLMRYTRNMAMDSDEVDVEIERDSVNHGPQRRQRVSRGEETKWMEEDDYVEDEKETDRNEVEGKEQDGEEEEDLCTYRFDEYFGDYLPIKPIEEES